MFVACLAFLLIVAGGLVTSNNAGLAVPDWPTSFGHLFKIPKMIGGVKFEHGHRMIAEFVGLLTIIVAVWTWRADQRRWMRGLTIGAVGGVLIQGILGGLTVLNFLPPAISTAHATVGQTMFCVLAAIAVFTSRSWLDEPKEKITLKDARPLIAPLLDADRISISPADSGSGLPPCVDKMGTNRLQPLAGAQDYSFVSLSSHPECADSHGPGALCEFKNADKTFRHPPVAPSGAVDAYAADCAIDAGSWRLCGPGGAGRE